MEGGTFRNVGVQREFKRFVEVRLHTDGRDETRRAASLRNRDLQKGRFGTIALPFYALLSPDGKTVYGTAGGAIPVKAVLALLAKAPKP